MPTSISPAMRSINSRQRQQQPTIAQPVVKAVHTAQHSKFTSWVLVNVGADMYEAKGGGGGDSGGGGSGRDTSRTHSEIGGQHAAAKEIVKVGALVVLRCEHGYMYV